MSLVIGIDPGLNGALCLYGPDVFMVEDMPTFTTMVGRKQRQRIDTAALAELVELYALLGAELAVIEAVGGRPKQSASAAFVFGYSVGLVMMALINARIPVETVQPQFWKKLMKMPGKKGAESDKVYAGMIQQRGRELFPGREADLSGPRGGVRLDRVEAAALAVFGHRHVLNSVRPDGEWRMTYRNADTGA